MTLKDIRAITGISDVRKLSETTTVVEFPSGHCRPATEAEIRMWQALTELATV